MSQKYFFFTNATLLLLLGLLLCSFRGIASAPTYDIQITVLDAETNEALVSASVVGPRDPNAPTGYKFAGITDLYGKITISSLFLRDTVQVTYVGYNTYRETLANIRNKHQNIIRLVPAVEIQEIVITAPKKFQEKATRQPTIVKPVTAEDIALLNPQTTADVIEAADVFIQESQQGGGSPVIRGFEANKVLIVIDGVRLNNAIYRGGHLQNVITIDNSILERAEVLFGPAAVVYGSDALGGVMSLTTKDPKLQFDSRSYKMISETNYYTRYSTATNEKSVHLDLNYGGRKWGSLMSFTYSDFNYVIAGTKHPLGIDSIPDNWLRKNYIKVVHNDDVVVPNEKPFHQIAYNYNINNSNETGYSQIDGLFKLKYKPSNKLIFTLNLQHSNSSYIPRYDQLMLTRNNNLRFGTWHYGPQIRTMALLRTDLYKGKLYDHAIITPAYQFIVEERITRSRNSTKETRQLEKVTVASLNADFKKSLDNQENNYIYYGTEYAYNAVNSSANEVNVRNLRKTPAVTRYPAGGSSMSILAFYANHAWNSKDKKLNILTGLRYTNVNTKANFKADVNLLQWPFEKIEIKNKGRLTGSFGVTYSPASWTFRTVFSSAFRAPNIDDQANIRIRNGLITVPNPNLSHEYAYNGELSVGKTFGSRKRQDNGKMLGTALSLNGVAYYTIVDNALVRRPFCIEIEGEGKVCTVKANEEEYDMIANVNVGKARIYGFSANSSLKINDTWDMRASWNYIKGKQTAGYFEQDTLLPLSHIPPTHGQISARFTKSKLKLETAIKYNAKKPLSEFDLIGGEDGPEVAALGYGTPAWYTLNFYSSYQVSKGFTVDFAVENIMDMHYRTFASGISAPGRNFIFTFRGSF